MLTSETFAFWTHPAFPGSVDEFGQPDTPHTVCLQLFDFVLFTNHKHSWAAEHSSLVGLLPAKSRWRHKTGPSLFLCSHTRRFFVWDPSVPCKCLLLTPTCTPYLRETMVLHVGAGSRASPGHRGIHTSWRLSFYQLLDYSWNIRLFPYTVFYFLFICSFTTRNLYFPFLSGLGIVFS